jgi:small subunit ribosomal protein S16
MLAIRMQRTGRKGLASFRVVVQDSKFAPNSGRVVAKLGHYNPHTKVSVIDKELSQKYLNSGAQPSPRVVRLLKEHEVTLPDWVKQPSDTKKRSIKNQDKLRKNRPVEEKAPAPEAEQPAEPEATEDAEAETRQVEESVEQTKGE